MKLLLISDTHGELERTREVIRTHPVMDAYIDLGDIGFALKELDGFVIVKGNHDRTTALPSEKIIELGQRRILCVHGDRFENDTVEEVLAMKSEPGLDIMKLCMETLYRHIAAYAKKKHCDTVFFGHTHLRIHEERDGIVMINPGSLAYGMQGDDHSYAIVEILDKQLKVLFCDAK